MKPHVRTSGSFLARGDIRWLLIWCVTLASVGVWDLLFLNRPALKQVVTGFAHTSVVALLSVAMTLVMGWAVTLLLHLLEIRKNRLGYLGVTFALNLLRSIPQIVGILFGYIGISWLIGRGVLGGTAAVFPLMSLIMSLFIFNEMVDLMRERIAYYRKLDFYSAMLVCGIREGRIINFDILWKNSRVHIINKLIAVLGSTVFLQCSVDFIISVGLSTGVRTVNMPVTLGSLLAKIDSKQDILAIGHTLTHPGYISHIFFEHLQGVTVAFLIVFTLLCLFNIANGFAERHRL